MQEQQFATQQKEDEEKAIYLLKEQFKEKLVLLERQLAEQKQQVRSSKSDYVFLTDSGLFTVH